MEHSFAICPGCERHVHASEPACPFCGVATAPAAQCASVAASMPARLAAIVALAATVGCSTAVPIYGAPAYGAPQPDVVNSQDAADE